MRLASGIAHERDLLELVLHHPLEISAEETVDEEDVERSLVVGNEDI